MWAADALDANHIFIVVNDRIDIHISPIATFPNRNTILVI